MMTNPTELQVHNVADELMKIGHRCHWWPSTIQRDWRQLDSVSRAEFLETARCLALSVLNPPAHKES